MVCISHCQLGKLKKPSVSSPADPRPSCMCKTCKLHMLLAMTLAASFVLGEMEKPKGYLVKDGGNRAEVRVRLSSHSARRSRTDSAYCPMLCRAKSELHENDFVGELRLEANLP
ncbi:hypothetical protein PV04_03908 [Phialophora macrospora]|uniref:Uncharacterized protein n=1 Tax=Phialophora macrospora TaxID=1851006 RepID=A0A0D2G7N4_9EURO|nr:hypothetical protein PV04_03908 [Phialophora macrospora]